jgi:hypothetical protein
MVSLVSIAHELNELDDILELELDELELVDELDDELELDELTELELEELEPSNEIKLSMIPAYVIST